MKALLYILLGALIAAISGNFCLNARDDGSSGLAALGFVGIVAGIVLAFAGLIGNHLDHTRRK